MMLEATQKSSSKENTSWYKTVEGQEIQRTLIERSHFAVKTERLPKVCACTVELCSKSVILNNEKCCKQRADRVNAKMNSVSVVKSATHWASDAYKVEIKENHVSPVGALHPETQGWL
jgi:hypothetical protein